MCFFLSRSASWTLFHNLIEICHLLPRSQEPMAASARHAGNCCILTHPYQPYLLKKTHQGSRIVCDGVKFHCPCHGHLLRTHNVKNGENHCTEHLESKTKKTANQSVPGTPLFFCVFDKKKNRIPMVPHLHQGFHHHLSRIRFQLSG